MPKLEKSKLVKVTEDALVVTAMAAHMMMILGGGDLCKLEEFAKEISDIRVALGLQGLPDKLSQYDKAKASLGFRY